jgi:hypothetical protein
MKTTFLNLKISKLLTSLITLSLMMTPFIAFLVLNSNTTHSSSFGFEESFNEIEWWKNPESSKYITLTRFAILSYVFTLGALGGFISILTKRENNINNTITSIDLIIIKITGGTFAIILLLFFWGGLISGELFPRISFSYGLTIYYHGEFAKLGVWSFIAGFSERLLPQIIENIQSKIFSSNDNKK